MTRSTRRIVWHPLAQQEAESAAEWYATRSDLAAERFVIELAETVQRITASPGLFPIHKKSFRIALMHSFPYAMIFREMNSSTQIVAVAHGKRRPGYWQKRLK